MSDPIGRPSWRDNDGVSALRRLSEALDVFAAAAPQRDAGASGDSPGAPGRAELPLQNAAAHVRFARFWEERRSTYLARRLQRNCPVCGTPPAATWFETQDGYRYVICAACRMVFIPEFLPPAAWDEYYAAIPDAREHLRRQLEASVSEEAGERDRDRFGRYLSALGDHGARLAGARLLDIGSFTGASLRVAAAHGLAASGVEGLAEAVQFGRARFPDIRLDHLVAEQMRPDTFSERFDVVTLWETLEHTVDPVRSLRLAADLMKPGAWIALTVPNARNVQFSVLREFCFFAYGGYHAVGHINMFSPESLRRALAAAGLELVHLSTEFGTDWRQLVHYLQQRFDRIHCYRSLVDRGDVVDPPGTELETVLNWLSPALTRVENACTAGPIMLALARRSGEAGR